MEAKYYLPLRSECLAHYLGHASILPSRYLPKKPSDIQNKFEDYLLISSNIWTKETDCCLVDRNDVNISPRRSKLTTSRRS